MKLSLTPFALVLASLSTYVSAQNEQIVFDAIHNATTIVGTWATGSKAVVTGAVSSGLRSHIGVKYWSIAVGIRQSL